MPKFGCIVPVAGLSRRMEAFKPLLPIQNDETMIACTVRQILSAGIETCVIILGHRGAEVQMHLEEIFPGKLIFLKNQEYDMSDMFYSIQLGVEYLLNETAVDATFILPGDMPCLSDYTFKQLQNVFVEEKNQVMLPAYFGKGKHPPLLKANLFSEILAFQENTGLRGFLQEYLDVTRYVEIFDQGCCYDADTPAEFRNAQKYLESRL